MAKRSELPPDLQEVGSILDQLKSESDRGAALIGAALIDDSLSYYIRSKLVDDDKAIKELMVGDVPCGTFSAKIKLAYCVGWIGHDLRTDLDRVRGVRNDFAHDRSGMTFDTQSIKDRCAVFKTIELHNQFSFSKVESARNAYIIACAFLAGYFVSLTDAKRPAVKKDDAHGLYVKKVTEQIDTAVASKLLDCVKIQLGESSGNALPVAAVDRGRI